MSRSCLSATGCARAPRSSHVFGDGRAGLSAHALMITIAGESTSRPISPARRLSGTQSTWRMSWAIRCPRWRSSPRGNRQPEELNRRCMPLAVQDGGPRPDHRRHPRRPAGFRNAVVARSGGGPRASSSPVAGVARHPAGAYLESGNMIAKQLTYLAGATARASWWAPRVADLLTSRADNVRTRLARQRC